jgi:hypothetical protein
MRDFAAGHGGMVTAAECRSLGVDDHTMRV